MRAASVAGFTIMCALALGVGAPRARGAEEPTPVRVLRPTAVRGAAALYVGGGDGLLWDAKADSFLGVTVSRQLMSRLAVEGTLGMGGEGHRRGAHLGGAARLTAVGRETGALTLGLGGHAAFLPDYGTVAFGHLELAWELRARGGFNLILGGGVATVLNDSRPAGECSVSWISCDRAFRSGDTGPWAHLEAGWAF